MAIELPTVFDEFAAILTIAVVVGAIGALLRQPLVVSFIVAGLVAGTGIVDVSESTETIELLSQIGITLLLFMVGLKLELGLIKSLGRVALATGLGQIVFTTIFGFLICLALGFDSQTSIYIAVALTFSSTIIIVKLLSDKREIDSLHGRIAIGFLIVQDLAVVAAMVALSTFGAGASGEENGGPLALAIGAPLLLLGVGLFMYAGAERVVQRVATSPELLIIFGIAWAVLLAAICDWLGLGKELGGLIAGVSLASTTMRDALASRLSGLRDFLLLFFFVSLGLTLELGEMGKDVFAASVLSAFVLIGNPLIVLVIMGAMGYRKRTSFLAGLTVSQISEFSLIFVGVAVSIGHIDDKTVGVVTLVGLVTIAMSTYAITYSDQLYELLEKALSPFERATPKMESGPEDSAHHKAVEVIVFGLGRYGGNIIHGLQQEGRAVLGVDFDPVAVARRREEGIDVIYGDSMDPEFVATLHLIHARVIVLAFPARAYGVTHSDPRIVMRDALVHTGFSGRLFAMSDTDEDARWLSQNEIEPILLYRDAADRAVELIEAALAEEPSSPPDATATVT
jgi:Kef-type K+ transport system membrane component KefB